MERLDKFLTGAGAGTRSQVKELLRQGRVTVNGLPVRDPGQKVGQADAVCLDGQALGGRRRVVLLLNKPAGYVTATEDPREPTVMELIPQPFRALDVKPVGRLDKQTEGLLLFTNDGALLHRLIAPRRGIPKIYYARHLGTATAEDAAAFAGGMTLGDGTLCRPARLESLGPGESRITLREGKYHQARRMMAARGLTVTYLERVQEGPLTLEGLPRGQTRELTGEEIEALEREFVQIAENAGEKEDQESTLCRSSLEE